MKDEQEISDLLQFLQRLDRTGGSEVRLHGTEMKLSFFGSTQSPAGIGDTQELVLVHRGIELAEPLSESIDVVVETRAVLDRLARVSDAPFGVPVPPVNLTAVWAGMLPPRAGWEPAGALEAQSLHTVAREGAERVATMLPDNPGQPLVDQARSAVWSLEIAPGVPAAAAFAIDALGFLREETRVTLHRSRTWLRLSTQHGEVFVRTRQTI